MARLRCAVLIAMVMFAANPPAHVFAQIDEKGAVEATVRAFEHATQEFRFQQSQFTACAKCSMDRRGVSSGAGQRMVALVAGCKSSQASHDQSATRSRDPHSWRCRVGDVFVDTTIKVDNAAARALTKNNHPNERKWTTHAVET